MYDEIAGRHGGQVGELAVSLPFEWSRGYVVPSVAAVRQSDEYTQYYFGVSADEAGGLRAPYTADGALNAEARLRWGYALSERWLLSGSVGVEFLGNDVSDSPIVERDTLWSAGVGLAWNADVFTPRAPARGADSAPKVEVSVGVFQASVDTSFVNRAGNGRPGSRVDIEDALNAPDSETVSRVDALWRPSHYQRLEVGYYRFSRDGRRVLDNTLLVGDEAFPAGTLVSSKSESEVWRVAYGYSLIRDSQKEFGVMAGLHLSSIDVEISIPDEGRRQASSADTPLPVIGAFGSVPIGEKTVIGAKANFFALDFDRYQGSLAVLTADVRHHWGERFSVGLAWHFTNMNVDVEGDRLRGSLKVRHSGPALSFTAGF